MLCDQLEGWDRESGREAEERGDMGTYVYISWFTLVYSTNNHNMAKQIYSNKDVKNKQNICICITEKDSL